MSGIVNQASINYLRFAALGLGVFYGAYRQQSLTDFVAARTHAQEKIHHRQLIEEALVAYEADQNRQEATAAAKEGIVTDSESYRFNAEKYVNWGMAYHKLDEPAKKN